MSGLPPCVYTLGISEPAFRDDIITVCGDGCRSATQMQCALRTLAPGQHLFTDGDKQLYIYNVQAGSLRLYKTLGNGRRQVIGFAFPGDFVGLGMSSEFRFNAQSIGHGEVRCLPKRAFHALAREKAGLAFRLYQATSIELVGAHDLALTVGQRDAAGALAVFLLWLSQRNEQRGIDSKRISLPMSRTDIADYLGLTGETVSRVFTRLKTQGLVKVTGRRLVQLTNIPALIELAEGTAGQTQHKSISPPALSLRVLAE